MGGARAQLLWWRAHRFAVFHSCNSASAAQHAAQRAEPVGVAASGSPSPARHACRLPRRQHVANAPRTAHACAAARASCWHHSTHATHSAVPLQTLVAVLPATEVAVTAVSALVRAMRERRRVALVRYALTANAAVALGALVPVEGFREDYPDHFVLCRVPWANEYRRLHMPDFESVAVRPPPPAAVAA